MCSEQSVRFLLEATSCSLTDGIWTILQISFPSCRRLAGSVTVSRLTDGDVSAIYVEASDTSTPLSSRIPYTLICHCLNTVKYEAADSMVLALVIFSLWYIFLTIWNCLGQPLQEKITYPSIDWMDLLHLDQYGNIISSAVSTPPLNLSRSSITSGFILQPFGYSFLSPKSFLFGWLKKAWLAAYLDILVPEPGIYVGNWDHFLCILFLPSFPSLELTWKLNYSRSNYQVVDQSPDYYAFLMSLT